MTGVPELAKIPVLPPPAVNLLRLLVDDGIGIDGLNEALRADAELAREVLQRVETDSGTTADTLGVALALADTRRIRKVAITLLLGKYLQGIQDIEACRRCWRHTLATAFLTEELAWACGLDEHHAYVAGLLHDAGRLGLLAIHPDEYRQVLAIIGENAYDILEEERTRFGMDHCEAGRQLAEAWQLPRDLIVIAGRHHDTPATKEIDLLHLTHLGCQMADTLGFGAVESSKSVSIDSIRQALPPAARDRLCANIEQLKQSLEWELAAYGASDIVTRPLPRIEEPVVNSVPGKTPLREENDGLSNLQIAIVCAVFFLIVTVLVVIR